MTAAAGGSGAGEEGGAVGGAADVPDRTEPGGDGAEPKAAEASPAEAADPGGLPGGAVAVYVLLAAAAVFVLVRNLDSPNDYLNFVPFGLAALADLNPYLPEVVEQFRRGHLWSTWPPAFAPVAVILASGDGSLGRAPTIFLWQAANLAGLAVVLAVYPRWLYGRGLSLRPRPARLPLYSAAALMGLLVPLRLVLSNFEHSQSNLLFLGLAVGGLHLFRRRRPWTGGLAVGLATSFKATPLLLLPYLAWRGRWRDLGASAVGCAVTWGLLPTLLVGPGDLAAWYREWVGFVAGLDVPVSQANQSLQGFFTRILSDGSPIAGHVPGGPWGGGGSGGAMAVATAVFGFGAAAAFGRPGRRVCERREALELGVVFAAMGLLSPIGWKFHFVGLFPLAAALWARTPAASRWAAPGGGSPPLARESRAARVLYAGLAVAALAINGTATGLVGGAPADRFEHWGVVTWSAGTLVLLALWLLWRERPRREPPEARPGHRLRHPGAPGLPA